MHKILLIVAALVNSAHAAPPELSSIHERVSHTLALRVTASKSITINGLSPGGVL